VQRERLLGRLGKEEDCGDVVAQSSYRRMNAKGGLQRNETGLVPGDVLFEEAAVVGEEILVVVVNASQRKQESWTA